MKKGYYTLEGRLEQGHDRDWFMIAEVNATTQEAMGRAELYLTGHMPAHAKIGVLTWLRGESTLKGEETFFAYVAGVITFRVTRQ
jgi:hypothetical protein